MFRRRAGHRGNVSLLDQDNVVLNQINITTPLLLSGEFTPRINSYRNQRFSYKHSRHLICLMQRNILLFLFLFFNLHHLGFKILHPGISKIILLSHLFIGGLIKVPGPAAATDQVYDASHCSNRQGGRRNYDTGCKWEIVSRDGIR